MKTKHVAELSGNEQRQLKRGRCPLCGGDAYDGTLDRALGHGDVCYECNVVFTGALTIDD